MTKINPLIRIFALLQLAGLCFSFTQSQAFRTSHLPIVKKNSQFEENFSEILTMKSIEHQQDQNYDSFSTRMLEEEQALSQQDSSKTSADKISLSMGNVLSSLNLDVTAMVFSKDKKFAYVTLHFYGTLKIIDISDLKTPLIVSSFTLKSSGYEYKIKSLILSSDEKTLYVSNSRDLEIIDVSYIGYPKLISSLASEIFNDEMSFKAPLNFRTSLALDERTMTLFIGGLGLQIYDVSNPQSPILLKAKTNNFEDPSFRQRMVFKVNEISLSPDGRFLLIANGTLDVYNISNPKEEIQLVTPFRAKSFPRSLYVHQDSKIALLLGTSPNGDFKIILEEVDISDPKSPRTLNLHNLDYQSTFSPRILAVSPSKNKVFIFTDEDFDGYDLLVYDLQKKSAIKNPKNLIDGTQTLAFSNDGKHLITRSNDQFMIVELFFNYPNKEIFSASPLEVISNFTRPSLVLYMKLSSDEKFLYLLRSIRKNQSFDSVGVFEIFDMTEINEPKLLGSYTGDELFNSMYFRSNENTVYLVSPRSFSVLDISNKSFPILKNSFKAESTKNEGFLQIVTTSDERTGILTRLRSQIVFVTILDLSSEIKEISTWEKNFTNNNCKMLLLEDNILLMIDKELAFYEISYIQDPRLIGSVPFGVNEPDPHINSFVLSKDRKSLFIETYNRNEFNTLRIYDISDLTSPQVISEKSISKFRTLFLFKPEFSLSMESGYIYQENTLVKMDLKDLKKPRVSGVIPLYQNGSEQITNYILSPDGQRIYVIVNHYSVRVMNINIKHSLYLKQEKFRIGEKYSGDLAMLNLTGVSDYDLMNTSAYKVIKLSVMDIKIAPNKYSLDVTTSLLPSWITFDKESNLISLEPRKQRDIGKSILHSRFSLKIPRSIFDDLGVNSEDLFAWLISLDFVDNQLFLTGNFGSNDTFYLPAQFSENRTQIYNTLKKFYVETSTTFEIVPSLEVKSDESHIWISTLSSSNIKVELMLEPQGGSEVKFVYKPYASLMPLVKDASKTQATLEGELKDVNAALGSIVVNFENGEYCEALMTVTDGLNSAVNFVINDVSRYFKSNKPPMENREPGKTVQEQIDQADIETGKYFAFTLSEETFTDEYVETLNYEIRSAQNGTATWLSLSGLTLKGTPPEEFFGRDVELILIAKNEFKQFGVPFKLHIRVSTVFILKLLLRYSPYILTLLGLIVSANKIFNIFGKKFYKHPKEFFVEIGEEVGVFPVTFLKEENIASKLILKQMMKKIPKQKLPGYFIDPDSQILSREKIIGKIQEANMEIPLDERKIINVDRKTIIEQIIINKFVFMQLNSKREVKTKSLFEDLVKENNCLEVVEVDSASGQFIINQRKFNTLIPKTRENLNENLIPLNMNLLKEAILTYAFEKHSLDLFAVSVNISVKQLIKSKSCWSFFKLDLKGIYFNNNNKIDYGINYRIEDDKLCFYGVAKRNLKDKTLVVQITNKSHKILKEIWIHGVSSRDNGGGLAVQDESVARGQGYEIF